MPHPASGPKTLPLLIALFLLSAVQARSQTQTFDLAAIHQNKSAEPLSSNVPLGPGDVYSPTAGILRATNVPLLT